MNAPPAPVGEAYRVWRSSAVTLRGGRLTVVSKPGVFAHGRDDAASQLLAEQLSISPGPIVVNMSCGNGLVGAAAGLLGRAGRVLLSDRSVLSVDAARRTVAANGIRGAEVFLAHGSHAFPDGLEADVVAIRLPLDKLSMLQLLWDAFHVLRLGGPCYLAGATNEGIKTAAKHAATLFGETRVAAYRSGHRVLVMEKHGQQPSGLLGFESPLLRADVFHEFSATLRGATYTIHSRPGVFSWDGVDEASALLADLMEISPSASVLDLGCGAGALGLVAAGLSGNRQVVMTDSDVEAVRSATRSASANGLRNCVAIATDVTATVRDRRFDVVVTNPPFHVGKATDLNVPLQFIQESWEVLAPGGTLFLVANRTLPYERPIAQRFGEVRTVHDGRRFKVLAATRVE